MIGVLVLFVTMIVVLMVRFKLKITKHSKYIIASYVVRDRFGEIVFRDFIVYDTKKFKFIKQG